MNHTLLHRVEDLRLVSNDRYHPLEIETVYTDPANDMRSLVLCHDVK